MLYKRHDTEKQENNSDEVLWNCVSTPSTVVY